MTDDLTAQEQTNVRAALNYLRARFGTWETLAQALKYGRKTVTPSTGVSARLAVRVARLAGVGVDDVLCGRFPPPGTCPHCGQPTLNLPAQE